jgi:hypothetical protein
MILAAVPIGFLAEVGMNGCCGSPSTGNEGSGFVLGGVVGLVGIALIVLSGKLSRKRPS